ncbi:MAG: rhodanese-like domain-containing protein [Bacteroidota bacterium]|nr:rhodanese-like domain-containing protein [Bacteroidota bacterium]
MNTSNNPGFQDFHLAGVKHISPNDAHDLIINDEAVLIDVRTEEEIVYENVPLDHVLYHPMEKIVDRLDHIAKDQNIILACPGGIRSTKVANLLNINGYPRVANLDGGFNTWKAKGLPWQIKVNSCDSCGCGCSSSNSGNEDSCC